MRSSYGMNALFIELIVIFSKSSMPRPNVSRARANYLLMVVSLISRSSVFKVTRNFPR